MTPEKFAEIESFRMGHPAIPEYEFPFDLFDSTPGDSNLGRIVWCVELFPAPTKKGLKRLREVRVWARQTRDRRYHDKTFQFEVWAEGVTINSFQRLFPIWRISFCSRHRGAVILEAYPEDHHRKLVVSPSSSAFGLHFV